MKYPITSRDKRLMQQRSIYYRYRLMVIDKEKNIVDVLTGISEMSSYNIDSESKIRRTLSFVLQLDNEYRTKSIEKKIAMWMGFDFRVQMGIYDVREDDYIWYECGYYVISESNTTYNAIENSLTCTLSDYWATLDGTRNGMVGGASTISIPNTFSVNSNIYLIKYIPIKGSEQWRAFRYFDMSEDKREKMQYIPTHFEPKEIDECPNDVFTNQFFKFYNEDKYGKDYEVLNPKEMDKLINKKYNDKINYNECLSIEEGGFYYTENMLFDVNFTLNELTKISFQTTEKEKGGKLYIYTKQPNERTIISINGNMYGSDENGIVEVVLSTAKQTIDIYQGYHTITMKEGCKSILESGTSIKDYIIEDVGEYKGMPQFNNEYEEYRLVNPGWNEMPFELEYNVGSYVGDMLNELCEIYPHTQMYFDVYGYFCYDTIPTCENEPISLDNEFMQNILLSENSETVEYELSEIKNVTEVWGSTYEIDRYSTNVTFNEEKNCYNIIVDKYTGYQKGDLISFVACKKNKKKCLVKINNLDAIPLRKEYSTDPIDEDILTAGETYVFEIGKDTTSGDYVAFYLGQFQPHAVCVLSDNADDEFYTKDYFAEKYNCLKENIVIRIEEESPFSVQKIGEILDVKTGDEFDNIQSDSIAITNAIHQNKLSSSWHDTVTLQTKMIPWLDVNLKISYRKQQEEQEKMYIIQSIDNSDATSATVVMYRFYPLYYL